MCLSPREKEKESQNKGCSEKKVVEKKQGGEFLC